MDKGNGKYNLLALCWGEGHGSSIHDHANSHCFMKMLQGSLEEIRFAWPEEKGQPLKEIGRTRMNLNDVCYINGKFFILCVTVSVRKNINYFFTDSLGLHRVENPSNVDTAISLHLYCPPYSRCQVFNQNTGQTSTSTVTFYSTFGKTIKVINFNILRTRS